MTEGIAVNCGEYELNYCINRIPGEGEFMIVLKYPEYDSNKIIIKDKVIEIQGKSAVDTMAMSQSILERGFLNR